jgi:peptidoglycan/LPS O-acetylase OafA/YrhL
MRYQTLDILRGLAAFWVVLYHFPFFSSIEGCDFAVALVRYGHLGVPVFFVISGYCLMASCRVALKRNEPVRGFIRRRLVRVYPPFWCSVAVVIACPFLIEGLSSLKTGYYRPPEVEFTHYSGADWARILTLTQVFFSTGPDLQSAFTGLNAVYWTLAIEVQFYLVMALALASRRWFGWVLGMVTVLSSVCAAYPSTYRSGLFLPYWPMFALGLVLYYVLEKGITPKALFGRRAGPLSALLLLAALSGFVAAVWSHHLPHDHLRFAVCVVPVLWVLSLFDGQVSLLATSQKRVLSWPIQGLFLLGTMSYTVYLLHGKVCALAAQLTRQVVSVDSLLFPVLAIFGTLLICYPFYLLGEKPFIRGGSARKKVPSNFSTAERPVPAAGSVLPALAVATPLQDLP